MLRYRGFVMGIALALSLAAGARAEDGTPVVFVSDRYGFSYDLPSQWRGFTVDESRWRSFTSDDSGPEITLTYPKDGPPAGEDITVIRILVFTRKQWAEVEHDDFEVSAAGVPPAKAAENSTYVIGLPGRWTFYGDGVIAGLDKVGDTGRYQGFEPKSPTN